MKKFLILLPLVFLALYLRLYKINSPVADWHSWRQADTASVAWEFKIHGVNLFVPHYQDLSNIPSGLENPQGYRMVEFPLFNYFHYLLDHYVPQLGFDTAGRLTAVIASLFSLVFLFLIVEKQNGLLMASLSGLLFAVLPFSIYYSRTILPEPLMVAYLLASIYFFLIALDRQQKISKISLFIFSSILLSLAILTKPYAVFFTLPLAYLALKNFKFKTLLTSPLTYLYLILVLAPFILWRDWIKAFPSGIPASAWLFNLDGIRFRPAWFRWLFAERLGKLILGYWGLIPFALGLIIKPHDQKNNWFYHLWLFGVLAYFAVFAGGNVTHDYYQAIIIPMLIPPLALGFKELFTSPRFIKLFSIPLALFSLFMMLYLSWYQIRGYYQINNPVIISAGQAVDQLLPQDAKVIAPYNGDTAFLYQTRRQGWPAVTYDISKLIDNGAEYYVSVNYDQTTNDLIADPNYQVLEQNDQFVIIKL